MTSTHQDSFTDDYWLDPHSTLARARENEPVRVAHFESGPTWLVTRYADVRAGLVDERLAKDWRSTLPEAERADAPPGLPAPMSHMLTSLDPPEHTRLRALVTQAFTARRIAALRPRVEQLAEELLDGLPEDEPVDLVGRYAIILPMIVICELLGVPELERDEFARLSTVLIDECPEPELAEASAQMATYLDGLVAAKRADPDDALLSALITASDEGDRLTDLEITAMAMLLLMAGHETTAVFLTNSVRAMLDDPTHVHRLTDPKAAPAMVEELLRWLSPAMNASLRFATEDLEIGGVPIARGESVMLSTAAADRDPRAFPDADVFDPDRNTSKHVAFGHGIHRCLGAALVRLEAEVGLAALFRRFPDLRATADPATLTFRRSVHVHSPRVFPVLLGPRAD
ncbi:cytochrome P450 [Actinosynnema pretiosum subsp. pretiosum]|uniref:Cytochrome P450 n=2 Tax=Actinosynnema TaxID=40566 RepID=C6WK20_ACTMD|nr:cytochrome P450 [Actinosynnema mirum]ACU38233.1 cytochrome P450 [Actinosynnema mirum DSM 43827]AXX31750.1 putative cytochrome P450 hydroxylase [Actinosynnema pretiosum subsp. pretiosum]QUF04245.1 cytochrome P450 [Actinosynnema pretiosum subsp. pretiosum]